MQQRFLGKTSAYRVRSDGGIKMPRGGSGPAPFNWTTGKVITLLTAVVIITMLVTVGAVNSAKYEDEISIVIKNRYERDSCFVLKTSTWEVTDSMLIIRSEERGSTRFFPLNEVKSIDVIERKVRVK